MRIFWIIFELTINFIESLILGDFLCRYLKFKETIKHKKIFMLALTTINFILISLFNYFTEFEGLLGIICYILIAFVFSFKLLSGTILQKIFISIFEYSLVGIISVVMIFLYGRLFEVSATDIIIQAPELYRFITNCSVIIILFSITRIILTLKDGEHNLEFKQWFVFIIIPIVSLIIVGSMIENAIFKNPEQSEIYLIISVILILVLNGAIHIIISWLNRDNIVLLENKLLKQEKEMQENHIPQIKKLYEEINILKHDLKQYAWVSKNLLSNGSYEELKKYLDEISEKKINVAVNSVCASGNLVVDGIINYKAAYAESRGITVKTDLKYRIQNISDTNISIILGNLLDNAIEASLLQENEKAIKISIDKKKEYIFIDIANKIDNSVKNLNPALKSTKKDKNKHGLGIKSVRNIAEKYKGLLEIYEEDGFFVAEVFIHEPIL